MLIKKSIVLKRLLKVRAFELCKSISITGFIKRKQKETCLTYVVLSL